MASLMILAALAIFAVAFPSTLATQYTVGDSNGWALKVNYSDWAAGKSFYVGDSLVFNYKQGAHNVVKIPNGPDFKNCTAPTGSTNLTSGADVIQLATPGTKWYICSVPKHCSLGMKLVITVESISPSAGEAAPPPATAGGPEAPPPSAATGVAFSKSHAWFVGVFSILMMITA